MWLHGCALSFGLNNRTQALDHFIRDLKAFDLDHGTETGHDWDHELARYRSDFEALLGQNTADGQSGGGGSAKETQIWANGVRPGQPMSGFGGSAYGVLPTTAGSFASPSYPMTPGVAMPYVQQHPAQNMAQGSYAGQTASYFSTPVVPGPAPHVQPPVFLHPGQTPGGAQYARTPPSLVRAQTASSAPWIGAGAGAGAGGDIGRDAGRMV